MTNESDVLQPLLRMAPGGSAPRVAVITGSYGAGHNSAANELARVLRAAGCTVDIHDIVALLPWRLGPVLRALYYAQLHWSPRSWETTLQLLGSGRRLHRLVTTVLALAVPAVTATTRDHDLVITTHPFGAQVLGQARLTGQVTAPVVTYLTDTSVHSLWIHPGVDLNLAIHPIAASEAIALGGSAAVVRALVPPRVIKAAHRDAPDPLASFQITGPRALVTGGSRGIGDLEQAARDIVRTGVMTPIVLCGDDDRLRRRLERIPGVVALGWREDLPAILATSDCVIQNAGGFTSLEALASGTPVITYRPLPGHGAANSINLERAGLVPWAHTQEQLTNLLVAARRAPRCNRLPEGPDVLSVLTGVDETVAAA